MKVTKKAKKLKPIVDTLTACSACRQGFRIKDMYMCQSCEEWFCTGCFNATGDKCYQCVSKNDRRCPTCGCYLGLADEDINGEVETEFQCNNSKCKSNNQW